MTSRPCLGSRSRAVAAGQWPVHSAHRLILGQDAVTVHALLRRQFDFIECVPTQKLENCFVYVSSVEQVRIVAQHINRPLSGTPCCDVRCDKFARPKYQSFAKTWIVWNIYVFPKGHNATPSVSQAGARISPQSPPPTYSVGGDGSSYAVRMGSPPLSYKRAEI